MDKSGLQLPEHVCSILVHQGRGKEKPGGHAVRNIGISQAKPFQAAQDLPEQESCAGFLFRCSDAAKAKDGRPADLPFHFRLDGPIFGPQQNGFRIQSKRIAAIFLIREYRQQLLSDLSNLWRYGFDADRSVFPDLEELLGIFRLRSIPDP